MEDRYAIYELVPSAMKLVAAKQCGEFNLRAVGRSLRFRSAPHRWEDVVAVASQYAELTEILSHAFNRACSTLAERVLQAAEEHRTHRDAEEARKRLQALCSMSRTSARTGLTITSAHDALVEQNPEVRYTIESMCRAKLHNDVRRGLRRLVVAYEKVDEMCAAIPYR